MNPNYIPEALPANELGSQASEITIAKLVGEVYETAPPAERSRMLEHLLRPLGVLSLVVVAHGLFAKLLFRSGWPELHIRLEDAQNVQASDVIALVDHVQQISIQAVDGLAQILAASPVMTGSGAAALLVTALVQRARNRRADENDSGFSSGVPT
ncbi:MAG TPA: hypothetical protein DCP03_17870 [Polaromonas sp.]|uniref:hypothetical protein n=1 Tax=Polaromonas sp. UBA4122 TaxID=1947074 RepID=UPI000EC2AF80|nr:hypothetical protein [Polaromonas sp. UBA4122]HAL39865.1 hypothetical protein [Polaromonas sp.]